MVMPLELLLKFFHKITPPGQCSVASTVGCWSPNTQGKVTKKVLCSIKEKYSSNRHGGAPNSNSQ